ncbi:hypothetical protein ACVXG8_01140 [Escherichia coli]
MPNPLKIYRSLGLCKTDVENKNPYGTYRPAGNYLVIKMGIQSHVNAPHTQLGTKSGRKGDYTQAREWGYDENGNLVPKRDIDFTDYGRPRNIPISSA